jgi:SAM-dependent methyltransferase
MTSPNCGASPSPDFYTTRYSADRQKLRDLVFAEVYDDYFGQSSWVSTADYDKFTSWLELTPHSKVLDVACGAGQPALRLAAAARCSVVGIDSSEQAVAAATASARDMRLDDLAKFHCRDGSEPFPFADSSFDAVMCVDALAHLPNHRRVFAEWMRILKSAGRLLFTAQALTGAISNVEVAARFPFGYYVFGPVGHDEEQLDYAGFELIRRVDLTTAYVRIAVGHCTARARHADALRAIEGEQEFELHNLYRATAAKLAREGRLSHFAYLAQKPAAARTTSQ